MNVKQRIGSRVKTFVALHSFVAGIFLNLFCPDAVPALPQAQVLAKGDWLSFDCRTLDSYEGYSIDSTNLVFSKYGGWKARRIDHGTGFFRTQQIDGRWWLVDPEGYLFIHKALNSIHLDHFTADEIYRLLPRYGFNGAGCWSDEELFDSTLKTNTPLAYCPKISFIAEYRRTRDPRIEMPVFDPEFEAFCNARAQDLAPFVNDPHVLGYFTDNELSWTASGGLMFHLALDDPADPNYNRAMEFITARGITPEQVSEADKREYSIAMAERYYSVVHAAIRNVDANHLIIGSRVNKPENEIEGFFRAAGKYVDVFSINHYHRWGARAAQIGQWSEWTGRPLLISEFYAMQEDPTFVEDGAGWPVLDQAARGLFYQNFVTTLAETKCVVGWHWFKFADAADGANKGIVDAGGNLYTNLLADMREINSQIYNFIDFADTRPVPDVELLPVADAYFKGNINHGADPELWVKQSTTSVYRASFLRFDLSALEPEIASAKLVLRSVASGSESGGGQAEFVADDSWDEFAIAASNDPPGSTVLARWYDGDDVEIDVTGVLTNELAGDQLLSIRVNAATYNGSIPKYGSRENTNAIARPRLLIHYRPAYDVWAEHAGLAPGANDAYDDDPENDGMDNLLEFALGAHPLSNDAPLFMPTFAPAQSNGTNWFNYIYRRRLDHQSAGLVYNVGSSPDLLSEPPTNPTVEAGAEVLDDEYEFVTNQVPIDAEALQFMQLKIIKE